MSIGRGEHVRALTLRVPELLYARVRKQAYDQEVSITSLILAALEKATPFLPGGCDECGATLVTQITNQGFRFCAKHAVKQERQGVDTP